MPIADEVAQLRAAPFCRGGRIVQFVCQPGGERAKRRHLFVLPQHCFGVAQPSHHRSQNRQCGGGARFDQLIENGLIDFEKRAVFQRARRRGTRPLF